MVYSFDHADAPSPHKTQYFEMMGVQGLYSDGWMLSAVPVRAPWELLGKAIQDPASAYKFELYDVRKDWTQYTDVAAAAIRQGEGDDRPDVRRVREIQRAAARRLGCDPPRLAASEPDGRTQGVQLHRRAGHRLADLGRAEPPEHVLHDHRRGRRAQARPKASSSSRADGSAATASTFSKASRRSPGTCSTSNGSNGRATSRSIPASIRSSSTSSMTALALRRLRSTA